MLGGGQLLLVGPPPVQDDPAWVRRRRLQILFAVACLGSLASAVLMAFLAPNGYTTRAYYGTDTRAQALLVGAAIAIGLTLWRDGSARRWFTRFASVLALAGVAGTAALWATTSETSTFAFSGGFLVASLAAGAVVLGCAAAPRSLVVRLLELPPLPQWGRISYGVYLWYWPVLLVMTGQRLHWGVYPLFLARVGVTVAIAAISYDLVEMPIRRGALKRWRSWVAAPIGAAAAISAIFISTLVPVGAAELQGSQLAVSAPSSRRPRRRPRLRRPRACRRPTWWRRRRPPPRCPPTCRPRCRRRRPPSPSRSCWSATPSPARSASVWPRRPSSTTCRSSTRGRRAARCRCRRRSRCSSTRWPPTRPATSTTTRARCSRRGASGWTPTTPTSSSTWRGARPSTRRSGGQWQNIGEPGFDGYLASRYRQAVAVLGSKGASVVLLTSPYYDSGTSPAGTPWPEDAPARVTLDNATMREVASSTPSGSDGSRVYVFDLNALVSPGNKFSPTVDQINVRCNDGVHFTRSGGIYVGQRLAPELATLGQAHATAAPGGAWAGPLPPSTPSWFSSLPCQ